MKAIERRKVRGRPKNSDLPVKPKKFKDMEIGCMMKLHAPLELSLISEVTSHHSPDPDLIEAISYASMNVIFRSERFRKALIQYRKYGLYIGNKRTKYLNQAYDAWEKRYQRYIANQKK